MQYVTEMIARLLGSMSAPNIELVPLVCVQNPKYEIKNNDFPLQISLCWMYFNI